MLDYRVSRGVFHPNFELSELERSLFREFEDLLRLYNFQYLAVPEAVQTDILKRQGVATNEQAYWLDGDHFLNGSAEQGILGEFADRNVFPRRIYSFTHCFRREVGLEKLVRLKEFKKMEQFIFCTEATWEHEFSLVLNNAREFLQRHNIEYRTVDVTKRDLGYHIKKVDIEIKTSTYGWVESHSCTYFGTEQTARLNITGANHTISNTGIASPRILIPFIERDLSGR